MKASLDGEGRIRAAIERFSAELIDIVRDLVFEVVGTKAPAIKGRSRRRRRSTTETESVAQKVARFIARRPGVRVDAIASGLGVGTHELALPIIKALQAGLIRKEGQRRATLYYPVANAGSNRSRQQRHFLSDHLNGCRASLWTVWPAQIALNTSIPWSRSAFSAATRCPPVATMSSTKMIRVLLVSRNSASTSRFSTARRGCECRLLASALHCLLERDDRLDLRDPAVLGALLGHFGGEPIGRALLDGLKGGVLAAGDGHERDGVP